jgi:hypothetical protein
MKKSLVFTLGVLAFTLCAPANVVRPAPNFSFEGVGKSSLRGLQGQPVVVVIGKSAKDSTFNKQIKKLKEFYQDFAAKNVVFVAALQEEGGTIKSDIPFVLAHDGAQVAANYDAENGFAIVIIGKDGNIDLQTVKVIPSSRVREVLISSFAEQAAARK